MTEGPVDPTVITPSKQVLLVIDAIYWPQILKYKLKINRRVQFHFICGAQRRTNIYIEKRQGVQSE